MLSAIFGGDISLKCIELRGANPVMDEFRLRNLMDGLVKNDGFVSAFSMSSASVRT
jgi:hypothetical protein